MTDTTAVPIIVHSATREPVEALNSLLRRTGLAVHCTWIPALHDVADALEQLNPELLISCPGPTQELSEVAAVRDLIAASVPLIVVREQVDEGVIAGDMTHGARDTVSLQQVVRLQWVIQRELRAFRLERSLANTLRSSQDYRNQLEVVLQRSHDAIAQVQEGILVDANASWLELFGYLEPAALIGQPVMDIFDENTHMPLKAALTACLQGRWSDHVLKAGAVLADSSVVPLELVLAPGEFDGDPSVRLIMPAQKHDERQLTRDLDKAMRSDPGTGLWTRRHLVELLQERVQAPLTGGVRYLAIIRPDKFGVLERELGLADSEQFLVAVAAIVRSLLGPHDIAGHFGGTRLLVLLERANARDAEAWSESVVERVARQLFQIHSRSLHATCTVGLSLVPLTRPELNAPALDALEASRRGRERGGNQVVTLDRADTDTRVQAYDQIWVKHIKSALMENRFRLVQHPIASLHGGEQRIFDIAVRMLDAQGKEVLPSEFLPAAERCDLMKNIDRWVIGASLSLIAETKPDLLFVRLSKDSMHDQQLLPWLGQQLRARHVDHQRLCLQVTEEIAASHEQEAAQMARSLHASGLRFGLEHFGTGRDSLSLINTLELDYLKIDGSLLQGIAGSAELQQRVRAIAEAAIKHKILTVAEHVEDANTMAVVWQLGVQFIQGYLVRAPEEVVLQS